MTPTVTASLAHIRAGLFYFRDALHEGGALLRKATMHA